MNQAQLGLLLLIAFLVAIASVMRVLLGDDYDDDDDEDSDVELADDLPCMCQGEDRPCPINARGVDCPVVRRGVLPVFALMVLGLSAPLPGS
jgi:hypothetical protein